ncbi:MAG TPA: cysteine desulfurase family protein [Anaerolineae bacterium]
MIYMDHSATTPVDPRVVEAMQPFWSEAFGNPSSLHGAGRRAAAGLDDARQRVAAILNCLPAEVVFTGCGTESDNLALRGVGLAQAARGKRHIITTPIEHHAIIHTAAQLAEHFDFEVTYLPVDDDGLVDPAAVEAAIRPDTALISVMYANNEVGTIEPLAEIGQIARRHDVPFHTDAVQAGGYLSLDVQALNVDLLSLSAHKFYGPKGVGLLYVRRGVTLWPMQTGGGQERGRRAGTENLPYIVGLARALELAQREAAVEGARLAGLRDCLVEGVRTRIPRARLSGHPSRRLPGHASFIIPGAEANGLLIALDLAGVAASSGSACASGAAEPSHVLTALKYGYEEALSSLRLTLGHLTTKADVDYVIEKLPPIVERLRGLDAADRPEKRA